MLQRIVRYAGLAIIAALFLVSCKLAKDDEDLPEEVWTITKVEYWINTPQPYYDITLGNVDYDIHEYSFFYEMDQMKGLVAFETFFIIPGVKNVLTLDHRNCTISIEADGRTPSGDLLVKYSNTWFYKYKYSDDSWRAGEWISKVKIATQTVPVTINTAY